MKRKFPLPRIGIIGGAGPIAGTALVNRIIRICQHKYGCQHDADFPYMMLISYPFANMLQMNIGNKNRKIVEKQIQECFSTFEQNGIKIAAIACNTIHEFLTQSHFGSVQFIHMIKETAEFLKKQGIKRTTLLGTETSALSGLHARYFPCEYPGKKEQKELDAIILRILEGTCLEEDAKYLTKIAKAHEANGSGKLGVVLGCTELPQLTERFPFRVKNTVLVDPMDVVADRICSLAFGES